MHIPDGYLSPSTCAVLYAGAAVGWYSALKRLKRGFRLDLQPRRGWGCDARHSADLRICGVFLCGDDVQSAAAGRHDRSRAGSDHCGHRAGPFGRDPVACRSRLPFRRYSSATAASARWARTASTWRLSGRWSRMALSTDRRARSLSIPNGAWLPPVLPAIWR